MVYETLQWTKSYVKLKTINHVDKIKLQISNKFQQLPKNSATVRVNNRCIVTGRSRGYHRDFGLSRHFLREMGHKGLIPGLKKASW